MKCLGKYLQCHVRLKGQKTVSLVSSFYTSMIHFHEVYSIVILDWIVNAYKFQGKYFVHSNTECANS